MQNCGEFLCIINSPGCQIQPSTSPCLTLIDKEAGKVRLGLGSCLKRQTGCSSLFLPPKK